MGIIMKRIMSRWSLAVWMVLCGLVSAQNCDTNWFGSSCQYKCHCENNNCNVDGKCMDGFKCDKGWFGPACQYVDLSPQNVDLLLIDSDHETCIENTAVSDVTFYWKETFPFEKVTLVFKDSVIDRLRSLTTRFSNLSTPDKTTHCVSRSNNNIDGRTGEIHCNPGVVQRLDLSGSGIMSLCSFIIGGANLIPQNFDPLIMDGDDETCTDNSNVNQVTLRWNTPFHFTWMRLVVKDSVTDLVDKFSVQFSILSTPDQLVHCTERRNVIINSRTMDIYCDPGIVDQMVLSGEGIRSLCSLYVSGGRNVALIQKANQTSTYQQWSADNAVDGVTSEGATYCISTLAASSSPDSWNVELSQPYPVNRYVIYNRRSSADNWNRLIGFVLTSFAADGTEVFRHKDPESEPAKFVYTVVPSSVESVLYVRITSRANNIVLNLCEVEIYSECPSTFHGFDCSLACSSNCLNEKCHAANGQCYGCVPGKQGIKCDQDCDKGSYGKGCKEACSENCGGDGSCDGKNGTCSTCKAGYKGAKCEHECQPRQYGASCATTCSENCDQGLCNRFNGTCDACVAGRKGVFCEADCESGTYGKGCKRRCSENCTGVCNARDGSCTSCKPGHTGIQCTEQCPLRTFGQGCLHNCSKNCLVNETLQPSVCHYATGKCLLGCVQGFQDEDCSTEVSSVSDQNDDDDDDNGPDSPLGLIVGVTVAAAVLIAVVVVGMLLWRRRKAFRHKGGTEQEYQSERNATLDSSQENSRASLNDHDSTEARPHDHGTSEHTDNKTYYNVLAKEITPTKTAIPVGELRAFMHSHREEYFRIQFASVPLTRADAKTIAALSSENKSKNRYRNIFAYDHSRVFLKSNKLKGEGDYINASYIEGYNSDETFIASQGPNKAMLNDFVRLLWEQKVEMVVMLTNLLEEGKVKCERYWPEEDIIECGGIEVKLATTQKFADYTIRKLRLEKRGKESKFLTHFHFTSWPDKGVPTTPWALVDFEQRVASYPTDRPIVVHCSAGVGRTGTFIGLRNLMKEAADTGHMDFNTTLSNLRKDRMHMIQTAEQYIFLHRAAQVAMVCMGTTVTSHDITDRMTVLEASSASGLTNMAKEFEAICTVCADCDNSVQQTTESDENVNNVYENSRTTVNKLKNRFSNVLPKDEYRPHLACDKGDYINAVFVPSFSKADNQFLTQLPLPTTVVAFWRLVTQFNVTLVVAFEVDSTSDDSTVGSYLPVSVDEPLICEPFTIQKRQPTCGDLWEEQKVFVTDNRNKNGASESDPRTVNFKLTHLKFANIDVDSKTLLTVVKQTRSCSSSSYGRTLYMCRNGATYSGLACVLSLLLDRMDNDQRLTVPLVVGAIKSIRPQVIPTLTQYQVLYEVLKRYTETSTVYCNFDLKLEAKPHPTPKPRGLLNPSPNPTPETSVYSNSEPQPGLNTQPTSEPNPQSMPVLSTSPKHAPVYSNFDLEPGASKPKPTLQSMTGPSLSPKPTPEPSNVYSGPKLQSNPHPMPIPSVAPKLEPGTVFEL